MNAAPFTSARVWRESVARRHSGPIDGSGPDLLAAPVNLDLPIVSSRDVLDPPSPFGAVGPHREEA